MSPSEPLSIFATFFCTTAVMHVGRSIGEVDSIAGHSPRDNLSLIGLIDFSPIHPKVVVLIAMKRSWSSHDVCTRRFLTQNRE